MGKKNRRRQRGNTQSLDQIIPQGRAFDDHQRSEALAEANRLRALEQAQQQHSDKLKNGMESPEFVFEGGPEEVPRRNRVLELAKQYLGSRIITEEDVESAIEAAIKLEEVEFDRKRLDDFLTRYSAMLRLVDFGAVQSKLVELNALSDSGEVRYYDDCHLIAVPNEGVIPVTNYAQDFVSRVLPSTGPLTYTRIVNFIIGTCCMSSTDFKPIDIPPEKCFEERFGSLPEDPRKTFENADPHDSMIWDLSFLWFKRRKTTSHVTCYYVMVAKQLAVPFFFGYAKVIAPFVERANRVQRQRFGPKKGAECYKRDVSPLAIPDIIGRPRTDSKENTLRKFLLVLSDQGDRPIKMSDFSFNTIENDVRLPVTVAIHVPLTDFQVKLVDNFINSKIGNAEDYNDDLPYYW